MTRPPTVIDDSLRRFAPPAAPPPRSWASAQQIAAVAAVALGLLALVLGLRLLLGAPGPVAAVEAPATSPAVTTASSPPAPTPDRIGTSRALASAPITLALDAQAFAAPGGAQLGAVGGRPCAPLATYSEPGAAVPVWVQCRIPDAGDVWVLPSALVGGGLPLDLPHIDPTATPAPTSTPAPVEVAPVWVPLVPTKEHVVVNPPGVGDGGHAVEVGPVPTSDMRGAPTPAP